HPGLPLRCARPVPAQPPHTGRQILMAEVNPGQSGPVVALLGTGIMGSAMARNLVAAGLRTTGWARSAGGTRALAEAGGAVVFGEGVADAFPEGCVWAQMGTIGIAEPAAIREQMAARRPGVAFVDAPVSGSKGPAEQ